MPPSPAAAALIQERVSSRTGRPAVPARYLPCTATGLAILPIEVTPKLLARIQRAAKRAWRPASWVVDGAIRAALAARCAHPEAPHAGAPEARRYPPPAMVRSTWRIPVELLARVEREGVTLPAHAWGRAGDVRALVAEGLAIAEQGGASGAGRVSGE